MFICNSCLSNVYKNPKSHSGSFGVCEICGATSDCNYIQSGRLIPKFKSSVKNKSAPQPETTFNIKDFQIKAKAVIAGLKIMGTPMLDYMSGELDKEFKRVKKYKRISHRRRKEMKEWEKEFLTKKMLEAYKDVVPILIDGYAPEKDRKTMKKLLLS